MSALSKSCLHCQSLVCIGKVGSDLCSCHPLSKGTGQGLVVPELDSPLQLQAFVVGSSRTVVEGLQRQRKQLVLPPGKNGSHTHLQLLYATLTLVTISSACMTCDVLGCGVGPSRQSCGRMKIERLYRRRRHQGKCC